MVCFVLVIACGGLHGMVLLFKFLSYLLEVYENTGDMTRPCFVCLSDSTGWAEWHGPTATGQLSRDGGGDQLTECCGRCR